MSTKSILYPIPRRLVNCAICAVLLAVTSAALLVLASCSGGTDINEDYTPGDRLPNEGAPVITAVYDAADAGLKTPITVGLPGQNIVIAGKNLNNLRSLRFNGIDADLSATYTASTRANVTIPRDFSNERINQIEYTTDKGTAFFDFVVDFPTLAVSHLVNEFAAPGTTVEIAGRNFDYYDFGSSGSKSSVLVDGREAKISYVSAESIGVEIPVGTPDNTTVTISWIDFHGQSQTASLAFRPTNSLLFADLSKAQRDKTDQCVTIEDDAQVTSVKSALATKHLHFSGLINGYAWVELSFSQNLPDVGDASKAAEYNFVFEVLTDKDHPLLGEGHEFAWNWDWANSCLWNPGNGSGLNTDGEWQTVRIPLADIAPKGIGKAGDEMTLNIGFQPKEAYEADFRMGNFRIQRK